MRTLILNGSMYLLTFDRVSRISCQYEIKLSLDYNIVCHQRIQTTLSEFLGNLRAVIGRMVDNMKHDVSYRGGKMPPCTVFVIYSLVEVGTLQNT